MKILKLTAENVKKLRAVEITPTGDLIEITGPNGAGKTSVLDSIWWALAGTKHIQAVPIRHGATKARIRLDLGELVVERRFSASGSTLVVENAAGARYTSPQGMLDALLGALTFDPLAFASQEPRAQFETLRRIVPLDVDIDQLDILNRVDFDLRTDLNRQAKALRAQADAVRVPDGLPETAIDTVALKDELANAARVNADIEARRGRREQAARDIADTRREAAVARARSAELRAEADRLSTTTKDLEDVAAGLQAKLDAAVALPAPVDAGAIRARLDLAEETNRGVDARTRKAQLLAETEQIEIQARALTETMDARAKAKTNALARADMPVPGLGFGDGVVMFGGIPFDQASTAEQLRVSVAMAMAANPKLRVLRIKEGSLLDATNLAMLAEMTRAADYQVWMERVDMSGKIGVVIEDGAIVAVDGEPVPPTHSAEDHP